MRLNASRKSAVATGYAPNPVSARRKAKPDFISGAATADKRIPFWDSQIFKEYISPRIRHLADSHRQLEPLCFL